MNDDWGGCGDNDEEATMMIGDDNGSDASLRRRGTAIIGDICPPHGITVGIVAWMRVGLMDEERRRAATRRRRQQQWVPMRAIKVRGKIMGVSSSQ